jgi:arylsulfatase
VHLHAKTESPINQCWFLKICKGFIGCDAQAGGPLKGTMKITRRQFETLVAGVALARAVPGRGADSPPHRPWNLVMITDDQHRADCVGFMGNHVIRTPNLDRLAHHGMVFENCFVQAPLCVPSRAALSTGRYPHVNRTQVNRERLSSTEVTLEDILNRNGYETVEVGELPFAPTLYTDGFQRILASNREHRHYLVTQGWAGDKMTPRNQEAVQNYHSCLHSSTSFQACPVPWPEEFDETAFFARHAITFLREKHAKPFFLNINFRRPHHPFDPPAHYDRMYAGADFPPSHKRAGELNNKPPQQQKAMADSVGFDLRTLTAAQMNKIKSYYYGTISLNDKYIGLVLDELERLGLASNTIVIFNADHGEMLGDHGLLFKGPYFYDQLVHVPFALRAPGLVPAGSRVSAMVEEIDVMPTILRLLGIPIPDFVQGRPLLDHAGRPTNGRSQVYSEFPTIKMVRTENWKLIHYVRHPYGELYNLREDPYELSNRYDDPSAAQARHEMESLLIDWLVNSQDPKPKSVPARMGP